MQQIKVIYILFFFLSGILYVICPFQTKLLQHSKSFKISIKKKQCNTGDINRPVDTNKQSIQQIIQNIPFIKIIIITYILHTNTNSDGTAEVMTKVFKFKVAGVGETGVLKGKPTI